MSYWVYLNDPKTGETLELIEAHEEGGTYKLGGTTRAEVNITYNYSRLYKPLGFSIRDLHEKTGQETAPLLEGVISALGSTEPIEDYWDPTPGNAGRALFVLLRWAQDHPEGVWHVS